MSLVSILEGSLLEVSLGEGHLMVLQMVAQVLSVSELVLRELKTLWVLVALSKLLVFFAVALQSL